MGTLVMTVKMEKVSATEARALKTLIQVNLSAIPEIDITGQYFEEV